jgi:asparagine synthase (glutamine-hydrolysing)
MCGIAGIYNLNNKPVSRKSVELMISTLEHRGPNDAGIYEDGSIVLGHRRLSILDLSSKGHQPMSNTNETHWIVHNGEVYNYIELKKELPEQRYESQTDTEVILKAYSEWGENCVGRFNGIFAFALWDRLKHKLFCVRDHVGVKPFYYAMQDGNFYFASEIKALFAAGVRAKPNNKIIYNYLVHGVYEHSEETFFEGINQLMPGCSLTVENNEIKIKRYWYLPDSCTSLTHLNDQEVQEQFLELLYDAIKIQLRSDVPIGCHLSGGIDSSVLVAVMSKLLGGAQQFSLSSYCYKEKYDEKPFIDMVAGCFDSNSQITYLRPDDAMELIDWVLWHEEQPFPGIITLAKYKLAANKENQNAIVFFEGHGGDEIAAGYEYYFGSFVLDTILQSNTKMALEEIKCYAELHNNADSQHMLSFLVNSLGSCLKGGTSADGSSFLKPHCLDQTFLKQFQMCRPEFEKPFDSHLSNMQYRDLCHTKLPRVLRNCDRASMASGREMRVPLLDKRLVEFAFSLPLKQRIRQGHQRYFLRNAFRSILPEAISNRPKAAVVDPQREWLRSDLQPWVYKILTSKSFNERGYFDQKAVLKEYDLYCKNKKNGNSFYIWQWVNLELWLRKFFN